MSLIKKILEIKSFVEDARCGSGLERQVLSHIHSFVTLNEILLDSEQVLHLIMRDDEQCELFKKYLMLHRDFSHSYFNYELPKDKHNRSDPSSLYSDKFSNLRPILDVYLDEIIRTYFCSDFAVKEQYLFTHDIDSIEYVGSLKSLVKSVLGDVFKRKTLYIERFNHYFTKRNIHKDLRTLLLTEDFEHLFFILCRQGKQNADYAPSIFKDLFLSSMSKGANFRFGVHSSYSAAELPDLFSEEIEVLRQFVDVEFVRAHYLKRSYSLDEQYMDQCLIDLTPYDLFEGGFYLPTSYPISLYSEQHGKNLFSLNTHLMDVTYHFSGLPVSKIETRIDAMLRPVKKYGGVFVLNWHNTSFFWGDWLAAKFNYRFLTELIRKMK